MRLAAATTAATYASTGTPISTHTATTPYTASAARRPRHRVAGMA